jgi:hypothetical protein
MQVRQAPSYIPRSLEKELLSQPVRPDLTPGLIVNADALLRQNPSLQPVLDRLREENGLIGEPALLIPPEETAAIFSKEQIDLLRSLARLVAEQIHPHAKTGLDAVWLVYGAYKLKEEWEKPDRNTSAFIFKLAGLGLGAAGIAGNVYPDLKLNDAWANGVNGFVKVGGAIAAGKTPPTHELTLSSDKRLEIPIKALKAFGVSLDPAPSVYQIPGLAPPRGIVSTLKPKS